MAYWWVNQGKTFDSASEDGYLWAPNPAKPVKPDWTNMLRLQVGDTVFCYSKKELKAVCTITAPPAAMISPYPDKWTAAEPGTVVLADFVKLPNPLTYKSIVTGPNAISFNGSYPVLQLKEKPALGYLFSLPDSVGQQLVQLCGVSLPSPNVPAIPQPNRSGTTRLFLGLARVGQGIFGKEVRKACNQVCAATGLQGKGLMLQAAHIKPWCDADDFERLDPENGILLHATLHHAFDEGLVSFDDNGEVVFKAGYSQIAKQLGFTEQAKLPSVLLTPKRKKYLEFHRKTFKFA